LFKDKYPKSKIRTAIKMAVHHQYRPFLKDV
jgi:hypothetical protein